jgi:hypothetical protein
MSATLAVISGEHGDHGWEVVCCTQGSRRCCLLETTYSLSDEKALWTGLSKWATFRPRQKRPRQDPGRLHCPNKSSHLFGKYWDYLPCLDKHPDFSSESEYTQRHMPLFSQGLSAKSHEYDQWGPKPAAWASEHDSKAAEEAAFSRLRPIQDGPDQWEGHRSSPVTGSGGFAPG